MRSGDQWSRRKIKLGLGIRQVAAELLEHKVKLRLSQDNMASIRTLTHEVTSWRTRHYVVKATWIKDVIKQKAEIQVGDERAANCRTDA